MADRVFRITFCTRLHTSSWREKKKSLYDSETEYKRGAKSYKRKVDRKERSMLFAKAVFEEFVDGEWVELEQYPEETQE